MQLKRGEWYCYHMSCLVVHVITDEYFGNNIKLKLDSFILAS